MQKHEVDRRLDERRIERQFIQAYGSENQYERFMAGLLPDDELFALVRRHLFAPFDGEFKRWGRGSGRLSVFDVRHEPTCSGGEIRFFTQDVGSLTHDEWSIFKKITIAVSRENNGSLHAAGLVAQVTPIEHVGRCTVCGAEVHGRAAHIRIEWAGRPLSREYTLNSEKT